MRAREADGGPDGCDECAQKGRAPEDGEQRGEELGGAEEVARAGEEDGEEVNLGGRGEGCQHAHMDRYVS